MGKYIDGSGLAHFMGIIKGWAVPNTRKVNGHALSADVTVTASDIGVAAGAEVNQNAFSNVKVGSSTIAADTKTDTLELAAGTLITLTPDTTNDKVTIATTAEVNQNAFSNVKVGSTTVAADAKTDTLELVAGSNVTLTPDATNDKVTIAATDTTYSDATTSAHGLMSAADKTKLDGIASGAEVNQSAFSNVKVGSTTVAADTKTDTLELAGSNVTLTPDATNDKVTIGITASNVTTALGNTAVARATSDASGNNIVNTYATKSELGAATAGALQYKGTVDAESTITGAAYKKGWYYVVSTAGTYVGKVCEVGDMLIAKQDKTSTPANDWDAVQSNIEVLSNSEIDALWAAA